MSGLSPQFEDVLRVLAITVIIDQHVRNPELAEFVEQSTGLAPLCDVEGFDASMAQTWYKATEPSIHEDLESRGRNTVILKALTRIKDDAIREALYDSILAISVSDKEYHRKESDLVRSAASIWGFVRPPFKVED